MSISSEEVNFLIQRYFQECGFEHSFYTFNAESPIDFGNINGSQIPRGALITLLQKGLLYIQLEKAINSGNQPASLAFNSQLTLIDAALREGSSPISKKDQSQAEESHDISIPLDQSNSIPLNNHTDDVFCCCWTSGHQYLASGSSDNTAIIWDFEDPSHITPRILVHDSIGGQHQKHQISTLHWSSDNEHLVTGCADGSLHLWTSHGEQIYQINDSTAPVHVVKFDPSGKRILSGDSESIVSVRVSETGELVKSIDLKHKGVLDASWKDELSFAVCCQDGTVVIFDSLDEMRELLGHQGSANAIEWSPDGGILASCSDDKTVRLWRTDESIPPIVLKGHENSVYALRWSSQGVLASASFDNKIRIWDVQNATCVHVLSKHRLAIYALSFSPDGEILVSGSNDQTIKFWRVSDGTLLVNCMANQNIFDLQYDKTGKYVAACFEGGIVSVIITANLPLYEGVKENKESN